MGMAASQARLLTITARLADNELRSQTINNAKMRLATQSAQASENYINALNNATYKFTNYDETGAIVNQALTFNALTAYSPYNTQYGLVNSAGQLLVSEAEANIFQSAGGNLDAYLKKHGLTYDTTYFNDLNYVNASYPSPFDNIQGIDASKSTEDLKSFFERYNSYETSMEVEDYEAAYLKYTGANNNLLKAGAQIMRTYLMKTSNSPQLQEVSGSYGFDMNSAGSIAAAVNLFKNSFGNAGNTYSIDALFSKGYISEQTRDACKEILNSYTNKGTYLEINSPIEMSKTVDDTTGETTYNVGGRLTIVTDASGTVINLDHTELDDSYAGDTTYAFSDSGDRTNLKNCLNGLSYTASGLTYEFVAGSDGEISMRLQVSDLPTIKEILNSAVDSIIQEIISDANYVRFMEDVKNNTTALGIDGSTIVTEDGKTLQEIIDNYDESQQEFLELIFGENWQQVAADIRNGSVEVQMYDGYGNKLTNPDGSDDIRVVTANNLKDIEFVLQYIKQDPSGHGLKASESFETVIKKYIMDLVIEDYGTPKYAWLDENDPGNTGNADAKAQWYTNLFKRMQQGYKALENGLASSKEWMEYALESGIVYMEQVDSTFNWKALDYKTCTRITEETDDAAIAKAEAEYNRAMNDIERKDNIFDLELKNIDTEHSALQTEYDVVKGVINKNIERNFKFNQSA